MTVYELTPDQLKEVKIMLLMERLEETENRSPYWGEIAEIDDIISDDEVIEHYDVTLFSEDDFFL